MNIVFDNIVQIISGTLLGILVFVFADWLAANMPYWPLFNHARDADKPLTYKIIGVCIILITILFLILIPLAYSGAISY